LVPASGVLVARSTSNLTTNVWTSSAAMPSAGTQIGPPLINGSYIYFLDKNAVLWKLNLSDGSTAGSLDLSAQTIDDSFAQIIYDAARDDVYATDEDGRTVFSVDVSTGTLAVNWSVALGSAGDRIKRGGAYYNNVLYIPIDKGTGSPDYGRSTLYALDVTDSGSTLWTNTTAHDNYASISSVLTDGTYVYCSIYDHKDGDYEKLLVIDASDGSLVATFDLDEGSSSAIPVAQNGYIIVGLWNNLGSQSIRVRTGGGTGDFPWKADSDYTGYIGAFMSGNVTG
jgi:hypothetical protein